MSGDLGSSSFSEFYEPCDLAEVITIKTSVTAGPWLQGARYVSGVVLGLTSTSKLCPGRRGATDLIWLNPENALRVKPKCQYTLVSVKLQSNRPHYRSIL